MSHHETAGADGAGEIIPASGPSFGVVARLGTPQFSVIRSRAPAFRREGLFPPLRLAPARQDAAFVLRKAAPPRGCFDAADGELVVGDQNPASQLDSLTRRGSDCGRATYNARRGRIIVREGNLVVFIHNSDW